MTADISADDLDALVGDQVTELFGWPVSLLDQIVELDASAHRGEIGIEEWRRKDAGLRAAGPAEFPRNQVEAARMAALRARQPDPPPQ